MEVRHEGDDILCRYNMLWQRIPNRNNPRCKKTPLYGAAVNGHTAVVESLLKAGANVNETPLYGAAVNGHTAVVEMLLKAGANVNKVSH
ncbi:hypothetical protein EMCRGX_G022101 [Ephydatia muelleri]